MTPEKLLSALTDIDEEAILDAKKPICEKKSLGHRGTMVLIAALMLLTLTITACASPEITIWFRQYFQNSDGQNLTPGQIQYIEDHTVPQEQSQTCNGYTITLDAAISDGRNALVKMTLTAPEDVALDADYYDIETKETLRNENDKYFISGSYGWNFLNKKGSKDNVCDILFFIELGPIPIYASAELDPKQELVTNLNEHIWTFEICKITAQYNRNNYSPMQSEYFYDYDEEVLAEGLWEFQIQFSEDATCVELIDEPIPCPAEVMQWPEWGDEEVLLTSFRLWALSAEVQFYFPEKMDSENWTAEEITNNSVNAYFEDIFVVMEDGSQILMKSRWNYPNQRTFTFDAPIVLEDVSHILLPDGTKIPMP